MPTLRPPTGNQVEVLEHLETPRGELILRRRLDATHLPIYEIISNGVFLMDSQERSSEEALGWLGLAGLSGPLHVLVGGLGLGYTLASVLAQPQVIGVDVVELEEAVVGWVRGPLRALCGDPLSDPRVRVHVQDLCDFLGLSPSPDPDDSPGEGFQKCGGPCAEMPVQRAQPDPSSHSASPAHPPDLTAQLATPSTRATLEAASTMEAPALPADRFHAILLDVDNGPEFLVHQANAGLYGLPGLARLKQLLHPGGRLALWSAEPSPGLLLRLQQVFGQAEEVWVPVERESREFSYPLYLAARGWQDSA